MQPLLVALPLVTLCLAALDTFLVRQSHPWRALEVSLFLQSLVLWAALGLLALAPARLTSGPARPAADGGAKRRFPAWAHLLAWTAFPVLAHGALDPYTRGSGFGGLVAARPWLDAVGVLLAGMACLFGLVVLARRVGTLRLAAPLALLALVTGFFLPFGPREAGASSPGAPAKKPNLLLLVWDTCRSDHLPAYGHDRDTTPHLAELTDHAVIFDDSVSVARFTFTSHVSMLTGLLPSTHGARLAKTVFDPRKGNSIADVLRRQGYRTGAFVGTDVLSGETGIRYGFDAYDDLVDPPVCDTRAWELVKDVQAVLAKVFPALNNNGQPHWFQDFQRPADQVLERALAWVDAGDARPWFLFINLYDVHWPYLPEGDGQALVRDYDGPMDGYLFRSDAWQDGYEPNEEDMRHMRDLYEAEIYDLDRVVDRFLGELAIPESHTAVLLTADHGEAFGEAGRWKHEDILEPQVRVPFILRPPGRAPAARRVSLPVSGIDVAPTLLGLAGLEPLPGMEGLDVLAEDLPEERDVLVEDRDDWDPDNLRIALYRRPFKLVRFGLGENVRYELYDLRTDPLGVIDVQEKHPRIFTELVDALASRRVRVDQADVLEGELTGPSDALEALGYMGDS